MTDDGSTAEAPQSAQELAQEVRRLRRRLERERAARAESERIAEDALRRMYEADELKTVLMGTVSHELRTPATIVRGLSSQLVQRWDDFDDERRLQLLERVQDRANRLTVLIEHVLELASLEVDTVAVVFERIELATWLPTVLAELEVESTHVLHLDVPPDVSVSSHPTALRQIVANVVGNAQRYGPPGSTITIAVVEAAGQAELRVGDEGPGIPAEDRNRVFEPFYRGSGDHVTRTSGFGIGLSVVRRLAALTGATVSVHTAPAGGAELRLRFPEPVVS